MVLKPLRRLVPTALNSSTIPEKHQLVIPLGRIRLRRIFVHFDLVKKLRRFGPDLARPVQ